MWSIVLQQGKVLRFVYLSFSLAGQAIFFRLSCVNMCAPDRCIKYLHKYVHKGPDRAMVNMEARPGKTMPDE